MQSYVEPLGFRTTYGYDANSLVNSILEASGGRTTINWSDWTSTVVTAANGGITTYIHNNARNITGVINPLGQRVTLGWYLDQAKSLVDGLGNATTLSFEFGNNRVRRISGLQLPTAER